MPQLDEAGNDTSVLLGVCGCGVLCCAVQCQSPFPPPQPSAGKAMATKCPLKIAFGTPLWVGQFCALPPRICSQGL